MYLFKYFLAKIVGFILYRYDHFWLTVATEYFLLIVNLLATCYYHDANFGYNLFCLDLWDFTNTSSYKFEEVLCIDLDNPNCKYTREDVEKMRFNLVDEKTVVQKNLKTERTIYFCFFISIMSLGYLSTYY